MKSLHLISKYYATKMFLLIQVFLLYTLWQLLLDMEGLNCFLFLHVRKALSVIRNRVVIVAMLQNCRVPSSAH